MPKLNYGCGESNLEGYINVDIIENELVKPDKVADIKKGPLPFDDGYFEEILFLHCIEHIEIPYWPYIFGEFQRLLQRGGRLVISWPEFEVCAKYFIENHKGHRDFWRHTLYGRQLYPGDYHLVPMRTDEVVLMLSRFGFYDIKYQPEEGEEWNTFLIAHNGEKRLSVKELYKQELAKIGIPNS